MSIYIKANDFPERSKISKVCLGINRYLNIEPDDSTLLPQGFYYNFGYGFVDYASKKIPNNIWGISIFSDKSNPGNKIYELEKKYTVYDVTFKASVKFITITDFFNKLDDKDSTLDIKTMILVVRDDCDLKNLNDLFQSALDENESANPLTVISEKFGGIEFKNTTYYDRSDLLPKLKQVLEEIYVDTGIIFNMSLLYGVKSIIPVISRYREANYTLTNDRQLIMKKACIDNLPENFQYIIGYRSDINPNIRTGGILYKLKIKEDQYLSVSEVTETKSYKDKLVLINDVKEVEELCRIYDITIPFHYLNKDSSLGYTMYKNLSNHFGGYEIKDCEGAIWNINIIQHLEEIRSDSSLKPEMFLRNNEALYTKCKRSILDARPLTSLQSSHEMSMSSNIKDFKTYDESRDRISSFGKGKCIIL